MTIDDHHLYLDGGVWRCTCPAYCRDGFCRHIATWGRGEELVPVSPRYL